MTYKRMSSTFGRRISNAFFLLLLLLLLLPLCLVSRLMAVAGLDAVVAALRRAISSLRAWISLR